jgi:hypothetical protein
LLALLDALDDLPQALDALGVFLDQALPMTLQLRDRARSAIREA